MRAIAIKLYPGDPPLFIDQLEGRIMQELALDKNLLIRC
jgi:hypothetical protein